MMKAIHSIQLKNRKSAKNLMQMLYVNEAID